MKRLLSYALPLVLSAIMAGAQTIPVTSKTAAQTRTPVFQDGHTSRPLANFRLRLAYTATSAAKLQLREDFVIDLPAGAGTLDLTYEHIAGQAAYVSTRLDGEPIYEAHPIPGSAGASTYVSADGALRCDRDYTVSATFQTTGNGTIFSKCLPNGKWVPKAKALFIRDGKLVYDIGWVGHVTGGPTVNDDKPHTVVLRLKAGRAEVYLDGKLMMHRDRFTAPDIKGHVFKIGHAASNFATELTNGAVSHLAYWPRAIAGPDFASLRTGSIPANAAPTLDWASPELTETFKGLGQPGYPTQLKLVAGADLTLQDAWVQPLDKISHATLIAGWNHKTLAQGKQIYQSLCVTCHGTVEQEGSLPTATKFHQDSLKNGVDPFRMYQTLTRGYGMMVPQPQYSAAEKYAVIQYIRESFLKTQNPEQFPPVPADYLASLPQPMRTPRKLAGAKKRRKAAKPKPYLDMDFGPALMGTYQVNPGSSQQDRNIANKGIAVRLDKEAGGVSKGRAWLVYEADTMRVAVAYTGTFVDWRSIAFDGSHGTHTSIAGSPLFTTPDLPAWHYPKDGTWEDKRLVGRDGRRYGPLPHDWVRYRGMHVHGDQVLLQYSVGDADILERPGMLEQGEVTIFARTLNIGASSHDLVTRLAPSNATHAVALNGPAGVTLSRDGDDIHLIIPAAATPAKLTLAFADLEQGALEAITPAAVDLAPLTRGGPARFGQQVVKTQGKPGSADGPFAIDTITLPDTATNPWKSWMRLGGFDFFADNPDRAAVCTWSGDVWLVDGIAGDLSQLTWRRICSGMFQPLGLKIVDGSIYVACRDQIAKLHDYNGDDEIDFIEAFNSDHQVTEHFHEFAMGLQVDDAGNFYYAKSARHAKVAVVPHHGTLLRVSPDGQRTDIVATGFRAANGVCLNPDGTWIVTDQEGHWNPKNRINYVREGGFYGNMYGYHDVIDEANSAMEQPLCWITNRFDRSPAELLWVPEEADNWGTLRGTLLNLSYGYGMIYTVPHEIIDGQAQGGMCAFPVERFPTGIHRGRFHPKSHDLYVAGMFAWAGSQHADGGFYRLRPTATPSYLPVQLEARAGALTVTFSDPLPPVDAVTVTTWDLARTKNYGSKHLNEQQLSVTAISSDDRTLRLSIPDLRPTWGMEVRCAFANGEDRIIHNTIHTLSPE